MFIWGKQCGVISLFLVYKITCPGIIMGLNEMLKM